VAGTRICRVGARPAEFCVWVRGDRNKKILCAGYWMLTQWMWNWHEQKFNATESLCYEGVEQLCQPKCLTGPKIMSVSSWGPQIEWLTSILANPNLIKSYWEHLNIKWNSNGCIVLLITPKLWCHWKFGTIISGRTRVVRNEFSAEEHKSKNQN